MEHSFPLSHPGRQSECQKAKKAWPLFGPLLPIICSRFQFSSFSAKLSGPPRQSNFGAWVCNPYQIGYALEWNPPEPSNSTKTWICDCFMLGKSSKNVLPNGGLKMIYHGTIRKKITKQKKNPSWVLYKFPDTRCCLIPPWNLQKDAWNPNPRGLALDPKKSW